MKEIIELHKRLRKNAGGNLPDDGLMLEREDDPEELEAIPAQSRQKIDELRASLNRVIPNDFDYWLSLGSGEPSLRLVYNNGCMIMGSRGHKWNEGVPIVEQLRELDWDEERKWAMQGSETFDAITAMAKELPVMIPLTKALQKRLSGPVREYIKEKRRDSSKVYALLWDGEECLFDEEFPDVSAFERELPDIMPHMLHVLTVVAEGKPMPAEKIDELKKVALHKLEDMPISHAKASGKFAYILAQAQREAQS